MALRHSWTLVSPDVQYVVLVVARCQEELQATSSRTTPYWTTQSVDWWLGSWWLSSSRVRPHPPPLSSPWSDPDVCILLLLYFLLLLISGGDLVPSLGGRKKISRTKWRFFRKKFPFSRPKFLMTFFSRWPGFRIFPFFSQIFRIFYYVHCRKWSFPHKNNRYFRKEFLYDTLFYSVRTFARIRQHYFSKYWGRMHGPFPTSNFVGTVPPVPPRYPPLLLMLILLKH